jgi:hypothetical protein
MVMKLEDFLKKAATAVFTEVVPGGGAILGTVNAMLPQDKQIPVTATGAQVDAAIATLPADQRAAVLNNEIDFEKTKVKEAADTARTMLTYDAKNPQSTRPYIAKHSFHVLAICALSAAVTLGYAVFKNEYWVVKGLADSWPFVGTVIAPLVYVLKAYFGAIQTEQKQRFNAANGHSIESGLSSLVNAIRK